MWVRFPPDPGVAPAAAPGSRRARRMHNDRILRDLAGPLSSEEINQLFAPPPWGNLMILQSFHTIR